jgi:hypothetical protein
MMFKILNVMNILKVVFKNALVDIGLSVLLLTGVLLGLRLILYNLAGPVFGAAITLFATGLYSVTNYLSTTTTLSHELDVECWSDDCFSGRISALVRNEGRVVVRDAKGVASIAVVRGSNREQNLKGLLVRDKCEDRGMLVNEINPHVIGEALAWALSEKPVYKLLGRSIEQVPNISKYLNIALKLIRKDPNLIMSELKGAWIPVPTTYEHITSISPGQRNRLLIFDYEYNWWSNSYAIKVYSEYGGPGPDDLAKRPYRACLLLDDSTKYEFEITVHGEGLREPLVFKMFVVKDKLNALAKSFKIKDISNVDVVMDVLKEFEKDGDKSLIDRYWRIRNRILEVKSLDEYKSVAKELESLWNEVRNKLGSKAPYFGIATGILNSYLVYLAAINEQKRASELLREGKEALELKIESNVLTKLMLRLLKVKEIKDYSTWKIIMKWDLIDVFRKHFDEYYAPAAEFLLGIYESRDEALKKCREIIRAGDARRCEHIVKAAFGDAEILNQLKSVWSIYTLSGEGELEQLLSNLGAKSLILAYLPSTPHARLALILYKLIEGDAESVRALAYVGWGWLKYDIPPIPRQIRDLFRELYDACSSNCGIDNEQLRLALLKLYHRLV